MYLLSLKPHFSKKQSNLSKKWFEKLFQKTTLFDLILLFSEINSTMTKTLFLNAKKCVLLLSLSKKENREITFTKKIIYSY